MFGAIAASGDKANASKPKKSGQETHNCSIYDGYITSGRVARFHQSRRVGVSRKRLISFSANVENVRRERVLVDERSS